MKYGTVDFKTKRGSISFQKTTITDVRHYVATDLNSGIDLGKGATRIRCIAIADSLADKIQLESLFHTPVERNLTIDTINEYYKDVIVSDVIDVKPIENTPFGVWEINVEFVALDPISYSTDTDEVVY